MTDADGTEHLHFSERQTNSTFHEEIYIYHIKGKITKDNFQGLAVV